MTTANPVRRPLQIDYPESDGKPMAETDVHIRELMYAILTLKERFKAQEDVYIAGNMFLYYEEGVPTSVVAPDLFFVRGIHRHDRRTYKLWEEGIPPQLVIELSSRSTRHEDLGTKRSIYREMGVEEYFLVDPLAEYLTPPLQGFRRGERDFMTVVPDKAGRLYSQVLGLWLMREGGVLRFVDPETDQPLLNPVERAEKETARASREAARADEEAARADREAEARLRAEAELARLRALLKEKGHGAG